MVANSESLEPVGTVATYLTQLEYSKFYCGQRIELINEVQRFHLIISSSVI